MLTKEIHETREKFFRLAKTAYPEVGEPGTVWVLAEVLGWEWDKIKNIAVEGFSRESYKVFIVDELGNRIPGEPFQSVKAVTRKWTNEEKRKLRDWWWLLGF